MTLAAYLSLLAETLPTEDPDGLSFTLTQMDSMALSDTVCGDLAAGYIQGTLHASVR